MSRRLTGTSSGAGEVAMQEGDQVADRYRILEKLGEGGMGVVFKAHDTLLERPVAIKTISPHVFGEEGLKRLLREARSAANLSHPNIVAVHDVVEQNGSYAIVMEFVSGRSLHEIAPFSLEQLAGITLQVLDALEFAHTRGIIHRDIKPENLMLTDEGAVKVMDFGLARSEGRSRLTQTGLIVGTVAYMAPEQALGTELDGRTDLYSLGCVLYELVTGRRPFDSEDPISVISQHLSIPPIAPRWHNKELPADWEAVILKLMAKDPSERYASAEETRRAIMALRPVPPEAEIAEDGQRAAGTVLGTMRRGRLVARDAELRELKGYVDLALSGHGQLALIAGEAGIGKTRLVREALTYARLRGCRLLVGTCYEQEGGVPYLPLVEAFRDYVKSRAPDEAAAEVGEQGEELIKILPELGDVIPGLRPSPPLEDAAQERLRLHQGITDFLLRVSQLSPLVLFFDDLHWADAATLLLLKHVARNVRSDRILILGAYRDIELQPAHPLADVLRELNRERLYERLLLRRLDREAVEAMVATIFSRDRVTPEFTDLIYRETEGNPFFVEEVLKHLVETGAFRYEDGRWRRVMDVEAIEVPQSVKEVIGRRFLQVSDECRQTLTLAAVVGKRFNFNVLTRMVDAEEDQVLNAVEEAIRSQLLTEEKTGGSVVYDFSHSLIRETLYDALSLRRRMRMHQRVGEALEAIYRGKEELVVEDLAFHFARAPQEDVLDKAVGYCISAAEKAARVHAHEEALKFYEEALNLLQETGREAETAQILKRMGEPLWLSTADRDKALAPLNRALAIFQKSGKRLEAAEVEGKIGFIIGAGDDSGPAIPYLERALATFEASGSTKEVTRTLIHLARARVPTGDIDRAERDALRARDLAVANEFVLEKAMASGELGLIRRWSGAWDEAIALLTRAVELCAEIDSSEARIIRRRFYNSLGSMASQKGNSKKAIEMFQQAMELVKEERNYPNLGFARVNLVFQYYLAGNWLAARSLLRENLDPLSHVSPSTLRFSAQLLKELEGDWEGAREIATEDLADAIRRDDVVGAAGARANLLSFTIDLEDYEEGLRLARDQLALVNLFKKYPGYGPKGLYVVTLFALTGRSEEAQRALSVYEESAEHFGSESRRAVSLFLRSLVLAAVAEWDQAFQTLDRALTLHEEMGSAFNAAWARWIFGRFLLVQENPSIRERGKPILREAMERFERMDAVRYVEEIRRRLTEAEAIPP